MTRGGTSSSRRRSRSTSPARNGATQGEESVRRRRGRLSNREDLFRNQDRVEKLRIGTEYRDLQKVADRFKLDGNADARELAKVLGRADRLFDDVQDTELAALDAKVFGTTTDAAANLIRKSKLSHAAYDVDELLRALKVTLGLDVLEQREMEAAVDVDELEDDVALRREEALQRFANGDVVGNWKKIGWMAAQLNRRVPGAEFMYGPLAVEHVKRVMAERTQRKEMAKEVQPIVIQSETQNKSKDVTATNVRIIEKVLNHLDKQGNGVNYFRLVVNPDDYGQTVENVFYTSFLIHEGRAGITVQDDGEVMVHHKKGVNPELDGDVVKNQAVIELTMQDWEDAIEMFDIRRSSIPNRARPTEAPGASGWYSGTAT